VRGKSISDGRNSIREAKGTGKASPYLEMPGLTGGFRSSSFLAYFFVS
jgi:hypothetical protein